MKPWKKALSTTLLCAAVAMPGAVSAAIQTTPMVTKDPAYQGVPMHMMNGVTYVSLRETAMKMGYTVVYNAGDQSITLTVVSQGAENNDANSERLRYTLKLMAGSKKIWANGKEIMVNTPPVAHMSRVHVTKQFADYYLKRPMETLAKQADAQYKGT
ncbi:stalk domain-containing protein [Paenibacillus gansuensis]|uniref:Stalk domain-containing protein n=1 Tax=Paenibacillus gansuensis TaxID=306542 RepID=A0ABW5PKX8_9BACL